MTWFGKKKPQPDPEQERLAVGELMDPYHDRASISDGERIMVDASQVLENIALAMERIDTDIDTPVSIEDDVASLSELMTLVQQLGMGPTLISHVVNTAMRIMLPRYPEDLVRTPLPPDYDLAKIVPIVVDDEQHERAKALLNRRMSMHEDLEDSHLGDELTGVSWEDQMQMFNAVFFMFGTKLGALKYRTGIA